MTSAYAAAGVDIDAGNAAVALMRAAVQSTYTPEVLAGIGSFGGLFDAAQLRDMRAPVLVASTDGVGTKVKLAAAFGRYASIGHDIVNHCINDILVQGARPLFFLDYIAASKLDPGQVASVVQGMAEACRAAGCALLGGETAEMPGVYADGAFDVAGTIVGVVEREALLPRLDEIALGDVLIGLASSGPHTNGYSLIRKVLADRLATAQPDDPLVTALLAPHRSYLDVVERARAAAPIKALAHITGGGFVENIPRVLPPGLRAAVDYSAWPLPPIFALIQSAGNISDEEMRRVFNCGIGMVMIVAPEHVSAVQAALGEASWVIGRLEIGD
ncbi:MAG: phosphoribosylformylglycinamidine cyclo-ligase [Anaerolineae bacterium]|nr:phosphoribosylformylglycinamidine cyclo-ligase [Candidatus Roseilinea sp.]MDW8451026.1 phosphoribosylformylglycinamidine cyclo-ligase [Anaerolineae bacterium]